MIRKSKKLRAIVKSTPTGKWWVSGTFSTDQIPELIDQLSQVRREDRRKIRRKTPVERFDAPENTRLTP